MGILRSRSAAAVEPTREQRLAKRIDQLLDDCVTQMLNTYGSLEAELEQNGEFEVKAERVEAAAPVKTLGLAEASVDAAVESVEPVFDVAAAKAAFADNTEFKAAADQTELFRQLLKTTVNLMSPGLIVDEVPEISLPS